MTETPKELLATIAPFGLRMQPELKEKVRIAAEGNNRSMNAEIVDRIEQSFDWSLIEIPEGVVEAMRHLPPEVLESLRDRLKAEVSKLISHAIIGQLARSGVMKRLDDALEHAPEERQHLRDELYHLLDAAGVARVWE